MWVDCSFGTARDTHRVKIAVLCEAVIVSVVLVGEDFVVVGLAASTPSGTIGNSRMHDYVPIAALVIAEIVFTASEDHEV
jgi:hypothetical protein